MLPINQKFLHYCSPLLRASHTFMTLIHQFHSTLSVKTLAINYEESNFLFLFNFLSFLHHFLTTGYKTATIFFIRNLLTKWVNNFGVSFFCNFFCFIKNFCIHCRLFKIQERDFETDWTNLTRTWLINFLQVNSQINVNTFNSLYNKHGLCTHMA